MGYDVVTLRLSRADAAHVAMFLRVASVEYEKAAETSPGPEMRRRRMERARYARNLSERVDMSR